MMIKRVAMLTAATALICAGPAYSINKCQDAAGKISYQNEPCPGSSAASTIGPAKVKAEATKMAPRPGQFIACQRQADLLKLVQFLKENDKEAYSKAALNYVENGNCAFFHPSDDLIKQPDGIWTKLRRRGDLTEYWTPSSLLTP